MCTAASCSCGYALLARASFSAVQTPGSSAPSASPCSSSQRSASMAARQPSPAAVTACWYRLSETSPAAKTPGTLVIGVLFLEDVAAIVHQDLIFKDSGRRRVADGRKEPVHLELA